MKTHILLLIIFNLFFTRTTNQVKQLPLLQAKENFNFEILDYTLNTNKLPGVIMVGMDKIDGKLEVRINMMDIRGFKFISLVKNKYFGYFEYKNRVVLVYGDDSPEQFFSKTKTQKHFPFLYQKPYEINKDNPPVSIEPNVFVYSYTNNQFTLINSGMLLGIRM